MNSGKYAKYKVLMKETDLHPYLPETTMFTPSNFWRLMNKYQDVILKPTGGGGGSGVIRVGQLGQDQYVIHTSRMSRKVVGQQTAFHYLKTMMQKRAYIIQQRISLAKYKGRLLDIRVMVQRRIGRPWDITGRLVKVAGSGFIITNTARSGGYVLPLESVTDAKVINQLDTVALLATKTLTSEYRGLRMVGMDMALDSNGNIWIIECNFRPAVSLFKKLKDKRMYHRILSYMK
ncbi:MAG TPA: YheC/YheD family protein [Bacillota bacterium]|nr:YheC/YheD family protein [Bacillota bacterium]